MMSNLRIVRNPREDESFKDPDYRCNICGNLSTNYVIIEDLVSTVVGCRTCFEKMSSMLANDTLENIRETAVDRSVKIIGCNGNCTCNS